MYKCIHIYWHQPRIYRSLQLDICKDLLRLMSARWAAWCTCHLGKGVGILGQPICLWTGALIKDVRCNPHSSWGGSWQPFWVKSSGSDTSWSMRELLFEPPLDSSFSPISNRSRPLWAEEKPILINTDGAVNTQDIFRLM